MDKNELINNFILESKQRFSTRLNDYLAWRKMSRAQFGRLYSKKLKSSMAHYFLNAPNATVYSIAYISALLNLDINYFVVKKIKSIADYEILNQDAEKIWRDTLINLGTNINHYRESDDKILLDLEIEINIDMGDLSKIENAKKNITIATLSRIAFGAKRELSDLLKK